MRDIDRMIDEAIGAEERDLLRRIGEEPGFIHQAFGAFGGSTGWVNAVMMGAQAVMFFAGAWAAWKFFGATEVAEQLRFGLPAAVLLLASLITKMALWPTIQTNRILRELRFLALQRVRPIEGEREKPAA